MLADCGVPMAILRSTISPGTTLEGDVRTYSCDPNTVTEGPTESICQINGQWSLTPNDLYCRRKNMRKPIVNQQDKLIAKQHA